MPRTHHRFTTSSPITLRLRNHAGTVEVVAADGEETTVEISSQLEDPAVVELSSDGRTLVVEPRPRRIHRHGIDMVVHLPTGSDLDLHTAAARVRVSGPVGRVDVATASGEVTIDEAAGGVGVGSASGSARVGRTAGPLAFHSASGSLDVGLVRGACTARSASGSVTIGCAEDDVAAESVSGSVVVRETHRGTVDVRSTSGQVAVGVRKGTLVWLDVSTVSGRARSDLVSEEGTAAASAPLTVRARSVSGSVSITSSTATA